MTIIINQKRYIKYIILSSLNQKKRYVKYIISSSLNHCHPVIIMITTQIQPIQINSTNKWSYQVHDITKLKRQQLTVISNIHEYSNNILYNSTNIECDYESKNSIISEYLNDSIIIEDKNDLLLSDPKR